MIVGDGVQFAGDEVLQSSIMPEMKTLLGSAGSLTLRCYRQLLERNFILTSSQVMIRRTVLDEVGLSDLRIPDASDWDLYLRIARRYDITFLNQSLTRWRYLAGSVSGPIHLRRIRWAPDDIAILRKQLRQASPGDRPYIKRLLKERIFERGHEIYRYGRESDRGLARKQLLRCLGRYPTSSTLWAFLVGLHLPREASRRMWSVVRRVLGPWVR